MYFSDREKQLLKISITQFEKKLRADINKTSKEAKKAKSIEEKRQILEKMAKSEKQLVEYENLKRKIKQL